MQAVGSNLLQACYHLIRRLELLGRKGIGHADHVESGALRRLNAGGRIFDGDTAPGPPIVQQAELAELFQDLEIGLGVGLALLHVIGGHNYGKEVGKPQRFDKTLHLPAKSSRGHGEGDAAPCQVPHQPDHAGKAGNTLGDDVLEQLLFGPDEPRQGRFVEGIPALPERFKKGVPVVEADVAFKIVGIRMTHPEGCQNLLQSFVVEGFGVHQNTVAIENHGSQRAY